MVNRFFPHPKHTHVLSFIHTCIVCIHSFSQPTASGSVKEITKRKKKFGSCASLVYLVITKSNSFFTPFGKTDCFSPRLLPLALSLLLLLPLLILLFLVILPFRLSFKFVQLFLRLKPKRFRAPQDRKKERKKEIKKQNVN